MKLGWGNLIIDRFQITQTRLAKAYLFSCNVKKKKKNPNPHTLV